VSAPRLVSRTWTAVVLLVLVAATVVYAAMGATSDGWLRWAAWTTALAWLLLVVAALVAFVAPRRRRPLEPAVDGTVRIESPLLLAGSIVAAWGAVLVAAVLWVGAAITGFDDIASPGFTLVAVVGALGSLPDLVRLLTGRLHRWRLVLGPDSLTYEGYRIRETVPYSKVHGARVHRERPVGVLVDRKGSGPDLVVPSVPFLLPADQLAEEVTARTGAGSRRR
jgi:hypothetical protein